MCGCGQQQMMDTSMPIDWNKTIKEAQEVEYNYVISIASQYVDAFNLYEVAIDPQLIRSLHKIYLLVDNPIGPATLSALWQVYDFATNCPHVPCIHRCEQLLIEFSTSQAAMDELTVNVVTTNRIAMYSYFANALAVPKELRRDLSFLTSSLATLCSRKKRHSSEAYCKMYMAIMFAVIAGLKPSDASQLLKFSQPSNNTDDED